MLKVPIRKKGIDSTTYIPTLAALTSNLNIYRTQLAVKSKRMGGDLNAPDSRRSVHIHWATRDGECDRSVRDGERDEVVQVAKNKKKKRAKILIPFTVYTMNQFSGPFCIYAPFHYNQKITVPVYYFHFAKKKKKLNVDYQ